VDRVSLDLRAGRTTGLVGESGSGKSMTALALLGLLPPGVETSGGTATLVDGTDVLRLSPSEVSRVRGPRIAMVFQDPMSSLDPAYSIGYQIAETLRRHGRMTRRQAQDRAANLLDLVGIQDARRRLGAYPHMLSGGMRQRVLIAIALANEPEVLIADEPTTALDVTTQAQILGLLRRLREQLGMAVLLITHDLGVVADSCDTVSVMYSGQVVESNTVEGLFAHPQHPYTSALLASIPMPGRPLCAIDGSVPAPDQDLPGCRFAARCAHVVRGLCDMSVPHIVHVSPSASARCLRTDQVLLAGVRR
jgi:oligopeptide/dipeptide ABC transporter ATP-binding protein